MSERATDSIRSRLRASDALALGAHGLRARPMRAVLSSLGIAIGIAAMISVIGISTSSQALVQQKLSELGTGLLTVTAGTGLTGEEASLPQNSTAMLRRIPDAQSAASTALLDDVPVYRSEFIDAGKTGGLIVQAASADLLETTGATLAQGRWLDTAPAGLPTVVLGGAAAERLGIQHPGRLVWLGGTNFSVIGILAASPLAPELDSSALIGEQVATDLFGFDGHPTTVYQLSADAAVTATRDLIPPTLSPRSPTEIKVSRPSDALAAKNTVDQAFTGLLIGVGSIALLVGGIGVANTMIISVLERRREIGLRRALGATKGHIRVQFLLEAILLSAFGGLAGSLIGWGITAATAGTNGWPTVIPPLVLVAGVVVTVAVGAIAGLLPAIRAARTSPTAALSS
ncbi:ABC transporter permease [Microbacterium sp. H1-D42]|uniref:ABC transporter permease n=1 Tax=Microbacterium sp. H1-D42 TaxID=2925844 RepID=UPI001F52ECFB|nr:ABC transporter permease [Microbacterium sp. H1-D42]UNK69564.1 ABC transporter permease [Microbacterium sp. H1-D42]